MAILRPCQSVYHVCIPISIQREMSPEPYITQAFPSETKRQKQERYPAAEKTKTTCVRAGTTASEVPLGGDGRLGLGSGLAKDGSVNLPILSIAMSSFPTLVLPVAFLTAALACVHLPVSNSNATRTR